MREFKLDRTVFRMMTFKDADKAAVFERNVPYMERIAQAWYLISQAYGFSIDNPPKLDRTSFSCRKHGQ